MKIPGRHAVIILECFIEIAVVAVPDQDGDFFDGEGGVLKQERRSLHSFFQQDLGEGFAGFLMEQRGNIGGVIREGLANVGQGDFFHVVGNVLDDFLRQRHFRQHGVFHAVAAGDVQ